MTLLSFNAGEYLMRRNYFIEGLQGAGKTTFVKQLSGYLKNYQVFQEGDYSPVELAWCSYVTEKQYDRILEEYPSLNAEIKAKTVEEGNHRIVCYTKISTDIPGFYKDMEKYEIYNGNLDKNAFESLFLRGSETGTEKDRFLNVLFFRISLKTRCCIS